MIPCRPRRRPVGVRRHAYAALAGRTAFPVASTVAFTLAIAAAIGVVPSASHAQGCLNLRESSPEAKLLAFYAAPLTFSTATQPVQLRPWQWQVALEVTPMPSADAARRTTQCYSSAKGESTNLASIFPRPRVSLGLPYNLVAELSYLPPLRVKDATANLAGLSLAWVQRAFVFAGASVIMQARAHTVLGYVEGPITCNLDALQADPLKPCYGRNESNDRFTPNVSGVEVVGAFDVSDYAMFAGVGVNSVDPTLQVDFTDRNGFRDRNQVTLKGALNRMAFMAGGTWRVAPHIDLTGQIYAQAEDVSLVRIAMAWRFGSLRADR